MSDMNSRKSYEEGGWTDGRLGQAYDLLDEVTGGYPYESGPASDGRNIMSLIENLDVTLEELNK